MVRLPESPAVGGVVNNPHVAVRFQESVATSHRPIGVPLLVSVLDVPRCGILNVVTERIGSRPLTNPKLKS
jgi:hypothetical protein